MIAHAAGWAGAWLAGLGARWVLLRRASPRWSAGDELAVRVVADHEEVFADDVETVPRIKALRPIVFAPHADPDGARSVAFEPLQSRAQECRAVSLTLVAAQNVQALDFAVVGCDVGVR